MGRRLIQQLAWLLRLRLAPILLAGTVFLLFSASRMIVITPGNPEIRADPANQKIILRSTSREQPSTVPPSAPTHVVGVLKENLTVEKGKDLHSDHYLIRKPFNADNSVDTKKGTKDMESSSILKSTPEVDPWGKVQQKRRELVKNVCNANADNLTIHFNRASFKHILVDDQRKVLYCAIPKAACTNWKRTLAFLTGKTNLTSPLHLLARSVHNRKRMAHYGLVYLDSFKAKDILYRLDNYFKFMMVRNPLQRILSAYKDKFVQRNKWNLYFQRKYGSRIVELYRKYPNATSLTLGNDVTFQEFVKYLTDPATTKAGPLNPHWNHFYKLCHPCHINYDAIGMFETFAMDTNYILNKISKARVHFPRNAASNSTVSLFRKTFKALPREDYENLVRTYSLDIEIFGYDIPQHNHL